MSRRTGKQNAKEKKRGKRKEKREEKEERERRGIKESLCLTFISTFVQRIGTFSATILQLGESVCKRPFAININIKDLLHFFSPNFIHLLSFSKIISSH